MDFSKKNIYKNVKKSWKDIIKPEFSLEYKNIKEMILSSNEIIFPNYSNIFETFKYFDLDETKVVILGQDCYINYIEEDDELYPQACGLAFSVHQKHKIPPSLKNIYIELEETVKGFKKPNNGDLSRWVTDEKILLLNCALTVEKGKSNSHAKQWEKVTDKIIKAISDNTENIVFILWGNFAKTKAKFIDETKHKIISGVHPSPLSARYNLKGSTKSFFGHDYFNKANEYLKDKKGPVNWLL